MSLERSIKSNNMNTEEKGLLLKEYSNRLPYGVKMRRPNKTTVLQVDGVCRSGGLGYVTYIDTNGQNESYGEISANGLVLFPIECLTKPITIASYNDGKPFVPIEELLKIKHADFYNEVIGTRYEDIVISKNHSVPAACFGLMATKGITVRTFPPEMPNNTPHYIIEKLNEWHINYRLPAHLFVPVTETFNPYK